MSRIARSIRGLMTRLQRREGRRAAALDFHFVDSLLDNGHHDDAERELFHLAQRHGHDPGIWERLFSMLWRQVGVPERAGKAHFEAMRIVRDPERWDEIQEIYDGHAAAVLQGEDYAMECARMQRRREAARLENENDARGAKRPCEAAWRFSRSRGSDDPTLSRGIPRVEPHQR